jgi:hypothetical protein
MTLDLDIRLITRTYVNLSDSVSFSMAWRCGVGFQGVLRFVGPKARD